MKTILSKNFFRFAKILKKVKRKSFLRILLTEFSKTKFDPSFANTLLYAVFLFTPTCHEVTKSIVKNLRNLFLHFLFTQKIQKCKKWLLQSFCFAAWSQFLEMIKSQRNKILKKMPNFEFMRDPTTLRTTFGGFAKLGF